jgi:hypothetical protein
MPCVENYCPVISRIRLAQGDVVGQAGPPIHPLPGTPAFPLKNAFMAIAYDQVHVSNLIFNKNRRET